MIIRDLKKMDPLITAIYNLQIKSTHEEVELAEKEAAKLGVENIDLICISGTIIVLPTGESTNLVDDEFSFQGSINELKELIDYYDPDDANPLHRGGFNPNEVWIENGTLYGYVDCNDGTEYTEYLDDLEEAESYTTTARAISAEHFHDQYVWRSTAEDIEIANSFVTEHGQFEQHIDPSVDKADGHSLAKIELLAHSLSDFEYHELCHQLNGAKSEFDGLDNGVCHVAGWTEEQKRFFTVKSALYRGIFWQVMNELQ